MSSKLGRGVDRRIAGSAFGLALVLFLVVAALNDAPVPLAAVRDPSAAAELVARMRAGERIDAIIEYDITRSIPGVKGALRTTATEARWGEVHVTRGPVTIVVQTPETAFACESVPDAKPTCYSRAHDRSVPPSEVFALTIGRGVYDVTPLPNETIAREPADCFRVRPHVPGNELAAIGAQTDVCLAADGLVLRIRQVGANATEEHVARRVVRDVDRSTLRPVFAGFDAAFAQTRR